MKIIEDRSVKGVGFTGSAGAEINSISFGGDTYYFGDISLPSRRTSLLE